MQHLTSFSKDAIRELVPPTKGNRVHFVARGVRVDRQELPPGLGIRLTANGSRTFVLQGRTPAGKQVRITIGHVGALSCADAAREAWKLLDKHGKVLEEMVPPRGRKAAGASTEPKTADATGTTVNTVLDSFVKLYVPGLRDGAETERLLNKDVRPALGVMCIHAVERTHITAMLDAIEVRAVQWGRSGKVTADRTLAACRKAFNWYAARDQTFNPSTLFVKDMQRSESSKDKPKRILCDRRGERREVEREGKLVKVRVYDDHEIWTLWQALERPTEGDEYGRLPTCYPGYIKMLLLTAQRRSEVAEMRWEEIRGDEWIIPASKYKSKHDQFVPLSMQATGVLEAEAKRRGHKRGYVFSTDGGTTHFDGQSKAKTSLDWRIDEIRRKAGEKEIPHWTLHALRRTGRTLMARVGVSTDIAELAIGHVRPGLRAIYEHHGFDDEMREALEKLANEVDRIVGW